MLYCVRFYEKKFIMRKNLLDQKQVQSTVLSDFFSLGQGILGV